MPALPSFIIDPLWDQFAELLPERIDDHPLGCHRPRIADRVVFDKLIQVLVLGAAYERIADTGCSATTIRRRRDEWITAGVFARLEQICLEAYDKIVGLELDDVTVDGCIVKAPCGGESAGKSPVDRGKQGTKRSLLTDAGGIPLGCVQRSCEPSRQRVPAAHLGASGPVRNPFRSRATGDDHCPPGRRIRLRKDP